MSPQIMKFLHKKEKNPVYRQPVILNEADFNNLIIRVRQSTVTSGSSNGKQRETNASPPTAVQLDRHMTAAQLLATCCKNRSVEEGGKSLLLF